MCVYLATYHDDDRFTSPNDQNNNINVFIGVPTNLSDESPRSL